MIVSADIGGTNAVVGLFRLDSPTQLTQVARAHYPSREHADLESVLDAFLKAHPERDPSWSVSLSLAGPIDGDTALVTNLGWHVDRAALSARYNVAQVALLNDLEATAHALFFPNPEQLASLTPDLAPHPLEARACRGVIAAGTGLGMALLPPEDSGVLMPLPSEGGHADFAPHRQEEAELAQYLREQHGYATAESVLSGPGLVNLYRFLSTESRFSRDAHVAAIVERSPELAPAAITQAGLSHSCLLCAEVVRWFVRLYGGIAGNFALTGLCRGGVYLGGGIAPRLLSALRHPDFREAFCDKDKMRPQLEAIRIFVVREPDTALHGAALHAARSTLGAEGRVSLIDASTRTLEQR